MGFGCWALIVVSVVFEVAGLGTVAWQLGRVQRREFGTPAWIVRLRQRWIRLRGGRFVSSSVTLRAAREVSAAGSVSTRKQPAADATLEQRVSALEHNLAQLDEQTARQIEQQNESHAKLAERVSTIDREFRQQQDERERKRREQLRESMAWQWIGTGLFLFGAVLGGWANGAC